jgi:hypothetical protein
VDKIKDKRHRTRACRPPNVTAPSTFVTKGFTRPQLPLHRSPPKAAPGTQASRGKVKGLRAAPIPLHQGCDRKDPMRATPDRPKPGEAPWSGQRPPKDSPKTARRPGKEREAIGRCRAPHTGDRNVPRGSAPEHHAQREKHPQRTGQQARNVRNNRRTGVSKGQIENVLTGGHTHPRVSTLKYTQPRRYCAAAENPDGARLKTQSPLRRRRPAPPPKVHLG